MNKKVTQLNLDTRMRAVQISLLNLALNHNAAVVQYASSLFTAGDLKRSSHERALKQFTAMHKEYADQYQKILAQAEAELGDGKDMQ